MLQLYLEVTMPSEYLQRFLQLVRDFDMKETNSVCEFALFVNAPDMDDQDVEQALAGINPPFDINKKFRKQ